jgi:hypothetical protein
LKTQQIDLITAFKTLTTESPNVVKILISSREDADIAKELNDSASIFASAIDNSIDIELFVAEKVNLAITSRRLLDGSVSEDLKNHITHALLDGANGMFLWPAMQLEYLSDRNKFEVEADIIAALKDLPPTLVKTFDCLYKRIDDYKYHAKSATMRAFSWLLAAERALSLSELVIALNNTRGAETFAPANRMVCLYQVNVKELKDCG